MRYSHMLGEAGMDACHFSVSYLCRLKIGKYHGYTSMCIAHSHPQLVPFGLNQWAHSATQLYTNKELAQTMGRHSYRLDWQAACQGLC